MTVYDQIFEDLVNRYARQFTQQQQPERKLELKEIAQFCQNASGQGWRAKLEVTQSTRSREVFRVVFRDLGGSLVTGGWHDSQGAALCASVFEILILGNA